MREDNLGMHQVPEYLCFGLLEHFDIVPLAARSALRGVTLINSIDRRKTEVTPLATWYKRYGVKHEPIRFTEAPAAK